MVSLVRVLDLSPSGWSALEVTQRRLVLSGTRLPEPSPVLCTSAPTVSVVLSPRASQILTRVSNAVDTMRPLSSIKCRWKKKGLHGKRYC